MSYFTETMGNLFQPDMGKFRNDLSCMYFPVSGYCKRV